MQRIIMKYLKRSYVHAIIQTCQPLTSVYLALHGNEVLSVTTESVYFNLKIPCYIPCYLFASAWLCGSASKWAMKTWCW
jgi:hypothetical protein